MKKLKKVELKDVIKDHDYNLVVENTSQMKSNLIMEKEMRLKK